MPTRGRQEYAQQAIECFLAQDYEHKRLIIVDDADDPSFPDGISTEIYRSVYYARMSERFSIGRKRNIGAEIAVGADLIAHFDSDDYSTPDRISRQVALLESSGKAVVGFNRVIFYEPSTGACGYWADTPDNICGTTMLYRRDWWDKHRFPEQVKLQGKAIAWGEDNHFRDMARDAGQLAAENGLGLIVARAHADSTGKKNMSKFKPFPVEQLPAGFPR